MMAILILVPALAGCAGGQRAPEPGGPPAVPAASIAASPALDGAAILQRSCTVCHNLRGLSAYADYWGEPEWRSMVETMIGYGAEVGDDELPVLVRYLAVHYGTEQE